MPERATMAGGRRPMISGCPFPGGGIPCSCNPARSSASIASWANWSAGAWPLCIEPTNPAWIARWPLRCCATRAPQACRLDERFRREARLVAALRHPNIVHVHDLGEQDGLLYIVMELVEGQSLRQLIRAPWPPRHALPVLVQVASALDFAHSKGAIHRDVKPGNILVEGDRALLTDFGIVRLLNSVTGLTQVNTHVGTLDYLSPEQAAAEPVTPAADVYALGVVGFELLTGRLPFAADDPAALLYAHIYAPVPRVSAINPTLGEAVSATLVRALAKAPGDRYPSAEAFTSALEEAWQIDEVASQPTRALHAFDEPTRATAPIARPGRTDAPPGGARPARGPTPLRDRPAGGPGAPTGGVARAPAPSPGRRATVVGLALLLLSLVGVGWLAWSGSGPAAPAPAAPRTGATAPTSAGNAGGTAPAVVAATRAPTASHAPTASPAPSATPAPAERWAGAAQQFDAVWGKDWPRSVAILETFLHDAPTFGSAREKLYAALMAYGAQLVAAGNPQAAVPLFLKAEALLPERGEAPAALAALTPTPAPAPMAIPAPTPIVALPAVDLNGTWLGSGWSPQDPRNNGPLRTVIRQAGASVTPSLVTGNDYIPAGQVSWRGTLQWGRNFPVQVQCAQPGYVAPYWVPGQVEIRSANELALTGSDPCIAGRTIRFTRG